MIGLGSLVLTASLVAQPSSDPRFYYHFFKSKRPLKLDITRVAIRQEVGIEGRQAGRAVRFAGAGLSADSVEPMAIDGWSLVTTEPSHRTAARITEVVRTVSLNKTGDFVSPVFVGDDGGPLIITSIILVGFQHNVAGARVEAILRGFDELDVLDRDWGSMKNAFRLRSGSRDGFDVLAVANRLAELPEVRFAEPDMVFTGRGALIPNDTLFGDLWGLNDAADNDMDIPEAWDITIGDSSIIVVVLDTGVQQTHPDIHQITPGIDTTGEAGNGGPVNACDNHGTAVGGCVSAIINNNLGVVGAAPGCRVGSARPFISTLDCSGNWSSSSSWTVNALAWAESIGARVTNNSNGYGFTSSAIAQKYEETRDAGMIHFASAMNNGIPALGYPSSLPTVNAVAALNQSGNRATFSNWGEGLAFSAPGVSIGTTDRTGFDGWVSGDYVFANGTSFASPYTAGVAALVLSVKPELSAFQVEQVLATSAVDLGPPGFDTDFGWGFVNAFQALQVASLACEAAPTPQPDEVELKNRYLSFRAGSPGRLQALRVTAVDLPAPFDRLNGATFWVGDPFEVSELSGKDDLTPPTSRFATLQCAPAFLDWSELDVVHVFHEALVPGGRYDIRAIDVSCGTENELGFSAPLSKTLGRWGDVVGQFDTGSGTWSDPDETVGVTSDVVAILDKFRNTGSAPMKARADIEPGVPDLKINITDVTSALDAFSGRAFPFITVPVSCP